MNHTLKENYPVKNAFMGVQEALLTTLLCTGIADVESVIK